MEPVPAYPKALEHAAAWAGRLHAAEGQTYGDGQPYVVHLLAVDAVLVRFGFSEPTNPIHQNLRVAALFHDLLEDITTDRWLDQTIRVLYGRDVLSLVQAVTSEPGANRAEKVAATLPKTRAAGQWAVVLKTCDRIANMEASQPGSRHFAMYLREYPAFKAALYQPGEPAEPLWAHLDKLAGDALAASGQAPAPAEPDPGLAPKPLPQEAWIF